MTIPRQPGELDQVDLAATSKAIRRVIVAAVPILLLGTVVQPEYSARWVAIFASTYALCGACLLLDRRGYTRAASLLQALGLWALITICALTGGGVAALAPWFFVIFVLATGLCFGARAGAIAAGLSVITSLGLTLLELGGWFSDGPLPYTPMLRWVALTLVLAVMAGLQGLAAGTIDAALTRFLAQAAEKRRTEESLRTAMERSEKFVESIDGIVWEADAETFQFTFVSPQAERLLGYPCSQWLSEQDFWQNHIHEDDRESAIACCLACIAELRPQDFEYRMIAADGRQVWIRDVVAVEAARGKAKTLRGIMMDITARKTAEHLVRESEERYRTLAETATDAIITIDPQSRILFANAAVERMFGYDRRDLLGLPVTTLMPERFRPAHETALQQYLATGTASAPRASRELTGLSRDGHELSLEVAFSEVQAGGQHTFTAIIRDVSERKRTEDALRSSERRFSIAFNANPTPSTISTLDGRFLAANEQFLITTGYSRDEVVGRSALELAMWPDPQQRLQLMERLTRGAAVRNFEADLRTKSGQRRVLLLSVERIELDGLPCFLHSGQDITERKLAENALRASEARLRALSARLESAREEEGRRIAREIHDELGGTLTALKWDLESVGKGLSGPVDAAGAERIRTNVPTMLELVESTMTSVRRIAADLRPAVLDDLGVIAAIEWQVRQFQARTSIRCDYHADADAPGLERDRATAVFRILQEILTNVLRHARATHVSVEIRHESGAFVLGVKDNGRGIADDELAAPRSLGLLGMRERALLAGGDVSIRGAPGGGTTVVVTIPIRELVSAAAAEVR